MHGMSMMPGSGGGGGGEKPKRPSGEGHPAVPAKDGNPTAVVSGPMPVVLTIGTIFKLASVIIVPLLGVISVGIYHYHKTNTHMDNPAIHLGNGERPTFETKIEANKARERLDTSIKREVKLQAREIKQDVTAEQQAQIKQLGVELKLEQKAWGDRLLNEVKQARRDIKSQ